jgi:hypothetical protein
MFEQTDSVFNLFKIPTACDHRNFDSVNEP